MVVTIEGVWWKGFSFDLFLMITLKIIRQVARIFGKWLEYDQFGLKI
jgi:hypothetical protein